MRPSYLILDLDLKLQYPNLSYWGVLFFKELCVNKIFLRKKKIIYNFFYKELSINFWFLKKEKNYTDMSMNE